MKKILKVKTVHDYNAYVGAKDLHPQISVINYDTLPPIRHSLTLFSVYGLFLRDDSLEDNLGYGKRRYHYDKGSLICVSPGQVGGVEDNGEVFRVKGRALLIDPEYLNDSFLAPRMTQFGYFAYEVNEALGLQPGERKVLLNLIDLIDNELMTEDSGPYQKDFVISLLTALFSLCQRVYERQFNIHRSPDSDVLVRFEKALAEYYNNGLQHELGLPDVAWFAKKLCYSYKYFGDLIKKETGETAGEHIRHTVIKMAKEKLLSGESVSRVASELGFAYPHHLSRWFSRYVGCTPREYGRNSVNETAQ